MTFTTTLKIPYYSSSYKGLVKNRALKRLLYFPLKTNEILIDKYLKTNYKLSLKMACKLIVLKSIIEKDDDKTNSISVIVPMKYWDTLARIITFGTGKLTGSNILRVIFDANN